MVNTIKLYIFIFVCIYSVSVNYEEIIQVRNNKLIKYTQLNTHRKIPVRKYIIKKYINYNIHEGII